MMNSWSLPTSAEIGGKEYKINADYRDVLEVVHYLSDTSRPEFLRWPIALALFYEGDIPKEHHREAMDFMSSFVAYGNQDTKPGPKLLDWNRDAQIIVADVNKVAGMEVRAVPFLHWWTFLSYFYGIGEGQLSTVISIRTKKAKGKKLEKWEQEYYRENKTMIDIKRPETESDRAEKESIMKYLRGE